MAEREQIDLASSTVSIGGAARLASCATFVKVARQKGADLGEVALCLDTAVRLGEFDAQRAGHHLSLLIRGRYTYTTLPHQLSEARSENTIAMNISNNQIADFEKRVAAAVEKGDLAATGGEVDLEEFIGWAKAKGLDILEFVPALRGPNGPELDCAENEVFSRTGELLAETRPRFKLAVEAAMAALKHFSDKAPSDDDWPTAKLGDEPGHIVRWLMSPPYNLTRTQAEVFDSLMRPETRLKGGNKASRGKPAGGS